MFTKKIIQFGFLFFMASLLFSTASAQFAHLGTNTIYTMRDYCGINTFYPRATLHVVDYGAGFPAILVEGASSTEGDFAWKKGEYLQMGEWDLNNSTFTERLSISSNGNVTLDQDLILAENGYGDKLSLHGNRLNQASMYGLGVENSATFYRANGKHRWYISHTADNGGSDVMELSNSKLEVNVPQTFKGTLGDKISLYQDRLGDDDMYGLGIESATMYFRSGGKFRFYSDETADNGASSLMTIHNNGSVGIGTDNSSNTYKLMVNGKIRAKEIKVETGWADYVFEDDYELNSLDEVATYIDTNGHLPNVPSAADVEANGVNLGEMDSILLRKIEELTLYMIDLKKENESQAKEIEALKSAGQ